MNKVCSLPVRMANCITGQIGPDNNGVGGNHLCGVRLMDQPPPRLPSPRLSPPNLAGSGRRAGHSLAWLGSGCVAGDHLQCNILCAHNDRGEGGICPVDVPVSCCHSQSAQSESVFGEPLVPM